MSAAQHIAWLNLVEKTGPFLAVGVLEEAFLQGLEKVETRKRQRVRSAYDEWRDAVDNADPQLDALHREWVRLVLEELLEYEPSVLKAADQLPATLTYHEPLTGTEVKPDFAVLSGDKARLLVARYAPDTDLSAPMAGETWAASPIERMTVLCRATGIRVGLITDGEQWTLVSVPADGASSIGTWYARIWQQEPVTLQAFVSLLEVRRCFGPPDATLDSLFLRSLEQQNEVTDTLGEQVRRAVEVLVQALDRADLDRDRQLLKDMSPAQLYEAGLTVMMRLVVLLCAEERKLLLLGEPIYKQNYAVSTLRSRLLEDKERLGEEVLDRRHDAWSRLLAVFRAVFGGIEHETLRLPALGGSLFDPDRFPFLEGRAAATSWRDTPAVPLPIDNRTVLMLLTALQVLEQGTGALLLSYEALDVEQIGHVYEGLLERTVKRVPETTLGLIGSQKAVNPNVPLRELETEKAAGDDKLLAYLLDKTGRSESGLKNVLAKPVDELLYHRVLLACSSDIALTDRIRPFSLLLRTDNWGDPLAYRKDAFIVTLGAGRRETGTHYTPKSITEPIVQHTLEPLVYVGPAEGKPREQWRLKTPAEILALKVCDMAMGSGAFLVQTCRWLADRLVEAWDAAEKAGRAVSIEGEVLEQAGDAELLPRDKAERVLIARRLIASRCLYGVDINPMAVELAKLSLWLVTMMKNRPFNFLDHALRCGDSLLGISHLDQLERFSIRDPEHAEPLLETANLWRQIEQAAALRRGLEALPSHTAAQIAEKARLHAEAETQLAKLRAAADFLVAAELNCSGDRGWGTRRAIAASQMQSGWSKDIVEFQRLARVELNGRRAFHWPLEFPEVFGAGGLSGILTNPPFGEGAVIADDNLAYFRRSFDVCGARKRNSPTQSSKVNLVSLFMERILTTTLPTASFGFVAPKPFLKNERYWRARQVLLERAHLATVFNLPSDAFAAASVEPCAIVARRTGGSPPNLEATYLIVDFTNPERGAETKNGRMSDVLADEHFTIRIESDGGLLDFCAGIERRCVKLEDLFETRDGINPGRKDFRPLFLGRRVGSEFISLASLENAAGRSHPLARPEPFNTEKHKPTINGRDFEAYGKVMWDGLFLRYDTAIAYVEEFFVKGTRWSAQLREKSHYDRGCKVLSRQTASTLIATLDNAQHFPLNTVHVHFPKEGQTQFSCEMLIGLLNSSLLRFI